MRLLIAALCAALACAQSSLDSPAIGQFVDQNGELRRVFGIAGIFVRGSVRASGVLSAACSANQCLAKTDAAILSESGAASAPAGPALFAFDDARTLLYFPESRIFAWWRDGRVEPFVWAPEGEILSIRLRDGDPESAVRGGDGLVRIVNRTGAVLAAVETGGPLLLLPDAILFTQDDGLVLRRNDGIEMRFDQPGVVSLFQIGPGYAIARTDRETYVVRITPQREAIYQLPESGE